MKIISFVARCLFIICLPVLLLTASVAWAANSNWLYEYGFEKYSISESTGLAETELEKAADGLISYFNSGEEYISVTVIKDGEPFNLFNEREVGHLRDVKGLFRMAYYVMLGTLVYVLGYAGIRLFWHKRRQQLARAAAWGGGLTIALMVFLGLEVLLNFDQFWRQFHLISFVNDLWLLNPAKDYLIMLFPSGFWFDATIFCALATIVGAVILLVVGTVFGKRRNA